MNDSFFEAFIQKSDTSGGPIFLFLFFLIIFWTYFEPVAPGGGISLGLT